MIVIENHILILLFLYTVLPITKSPENPFSVCKIKSRQTFQEIRVSQKIISGFQNRPRLASSRPDEGWKQISFGHIYPIGLERVFTSLSFRCIPPDLGRTNQRPLDLGSVEDALQHVYNHLQLGSVNRCFATFTNIYNSSASQIFGAFTNIYN